MIRISDTGGFIVSKLATCMIFNFAGKPCKEVQLNVRELIESRPGFTFLVAGMYDFFNKDQVHYHYSSIHGGEPSVSDA